MTSPNTTPIICGACQFTCYELDEMNQHMADKHGKALFSDVASPNPSPKAEAAIESAMRKAHEQQEALSLTSKMLNEFRDEILRVSEVTHKPITKDDRSPEPLVKLPLKTLTETVQTLIDAAVAEGAIAALLELKADMMQHTVPEGSDLITRSYLNNAIDFMVADKKP